ncbi:P-loop containing nucleoside triphosphate hydrolase protein [Chlamydoabsidia padenii]|nr:P-loop containing nucleoside triphosphate hydrolase protein [Chlamydoabsidia padenii]
MSLKDSEHNTLAAVQVAVRIRPLSDKDRSQPRFAHATNDDVLQAHENTVVISPPHNKIFTFDHVFGPQTQQADIFAALGQKSIRKFVEGYNVTMLAYGQTSSGKTYTVGTAHHTGRYHPEQEGIVPRAMALLFDLLHQNDTRPTSPVASLSASSSVDGTSTTTTTKGRLRPVSRISYSSFNNTSTSTSSSTSSTSSNSGHNNKYKFTVKVSFVEIYNEELIDLLNFAPPNERPPVTIREDTKGQIYWTGVKEMNVNNTDDVLMYLQQGTQNRATGATDMNEQSSRSHAIFSVTLRQEKWTPSASSSSSHNTPRTASPTSPRSKPRPLSAMNLRMNDNPPNDEAGEWIITTSKLHFVDLAGSERLKRTAAEGDRRKEGININGGLLALGNVISALGDASKKSTHIPYRDSKLTRLLQDSLGGSAMTLMIACVSPMEYNISETLNTLQYANRARNIKNRMEKNEVEEWLTTDNLDLLRSTITKLKNELKQRSLPKGGESRLSLVASSSRQLISDGDQLQEHQMVVADLHRQLEEVSSQAAVTKERNRILEDEIKALQSKGSDGNGATFQDTVKPIIEEYETSMTSLETKLSLAQAELNHSNFRIAKLQALVGLQTGAEIQEGAAFECLEPLIQEYEKSMASLESKLSLNQAALNQSNFRIAELQALVGPQTGARTREGAASECMEPLIQEYERSMATLESKLSLTQAALNQSDFRIEELQTLMQTQDVTANDLKAQLDKLKEQERHNLAYIEELEGKLSFTVKDAVQDEELLNELKNRIMKFKELDDSTELYILDLEKQLANNEAEYTNKVDQHQKTITQQKERIEELEQEVRDLQAQQKGGDGGGMDYVKERQTLHEQIAKLEQDLMVLTTQLQHQQPYMDGMEDQQHRLSISPTTMDPNHEKRKRMFSSGGNPRQLGNKNNLLQSTLASLEHVQSEYVALKERYKHWTVASHTTVDDTPPQGMAPTMSTGSFSSSSFDSISTTSTQKPPPPSTTSSSSSSSSTGSLSNDIQDIQTKCDDIVQQYQNQSQRIHGALQRIAKLERSSSSEPSQQQEALVDLGQQLRDRDMSLQEACTRFQTDIYENNEEHIMQRLARALQDVELHRSKTYVLQTKLQKIEVAFHTQQQRKSSASEDQDGIEQLMKKMDAIKIQLESRDIKSISVKEG